MTLDDLVAYGADVESGLARCMGMEAVYLQLVASVQDEESFARLRDAIDAHDWETAFTVAHSLKGVLGNLALTPLYDPVCELTELLRPRAAVDCAELFGRVWDAWQELRAL